MKIAVLYNRDIYAYRALTRLLPALADHALALFHTTGVGRVATAHDDALASLRSFESGLLATGDDKPNAQVDQRNDSPDRTLFSELIGYHDIEDTAMGHINTPGGCQQLAQFEPDLMVSIRFGKILKQAAIDIPKRGVLNLHSGPLPEYRGVMPTFWGMLAGEKNIGTTLHWITDPSIDTGPVVSRTRRTTDFQACYVKNVLSLYDDGVRAVLTAIESIECGALAPGRGAYSIDATLPQHGNYFTFPTSAELERFSERGLVLYDERTREEICSIIRRGKPLPSNVE